MRANYDIIDSVYPGKRVVRFGIDPPDGNAGWVDNEIVGDGGNIVIDENETLEDAIQKGIAKGFLRQ